jgi:hypothetical protein
MHGLIFETSICYWQDQPDIFPFTKQREAGFSRHHLPPFQTRHLHVWFCPVLFHTGHGTGQASNPTAFRLALYRGIQFLARTVETHSGSIQVESIRPSLRPGTLSHCSGAVVSRTNTLTHWGRFRRPKPELPLTGLIFNTSPLYTGIQTPGVLLPRAVPSSV